MTKKEKKDNLQLTVNYVREIKELADSLVEDMKDADSMTAAWKKIDRFYQGIEGMRNRQKCTGSKSFSIMQDDIGEGHTKYLQGLHLPMMLNTIVGEDGSLHPSAVSEMHIDMVNGITTLLITPEIVGL